MKRFSPYIAPRLPMGTRVASMVPDPDGEWVRRDDAIDFAREYARRACRGFVARLVLRAKAQPRLITRDSFIAWLREAL